MNSRNSLPHKGTSPTALQLAALLLCLLLPCACTTNITDDARQEQAAATPLVVLLGGTRQALFSLRIPVEFSMQSKYALRANSDELYPLTVHPGSSPGRLTFSLAKVPERTARCALVRLNTNGQQTEVLEEAVQLIKNFRILLSFDDGPAVCDSPNDGEITCSPTWQTLQALENFQHGPNNSRQGIKAIFFILSQPDHFMHFTYPKAETADGAALLREEARRGHVLGVHWGGSYYGQTVLHTKRVLQPAYAFSTEYTGKGAQNALECDLRECAGRIKNITGKQLEFVRPPLWRYSDENNFLIKQQVLDTYRRLGLRMILTDARYPDGGYSMISVLLPNANAMFKRNLHKAFQSGEDTLIISMHDSNTTTAQRLPQILRTICDAFAQEKFGKQSGAPGIYLKFADTTAEVESILRNKRQFTLFPAYRPE